MGCDLVFVLLNIDGFARVSLFLIALSSTCLLSERPDSELDEWVLLSLLVKLNIVGDMSLLGDSFVVSLLLGIYNSPISKSFSLSGVYDLFS